MPMRSPDMTPVSAADRAACRRLIRAGSKSFATASLLLPGGIRDAAYALYGFCRLSDDLVDIEGGADDAVAALRQRLALAYDRRPLDHPVDRAFSSVVTRYAIPRALPDALIDGLDWDVKAVRCDNLADLYRYAARVAGSVGAMMTVLMGVRDSDSLARACDLGVAMQLTNIARDVGEDAANGRLYLPRDWLRAEGIDPDEWLAAPCFTPAIGRVVSRLLRTADWLYARADSGIGRLPWRCRAGIFAARHIYREIGVEVARRQFDSLSVRARVPGRRKLRLVARAWRDALRRQPPAVVGPPLIETAFLVDAVLTSAQGPAPPLPRIAHRILWVAELFASLDARDRVGAR